MFMDALLADSGTVRTVAVTFEPVPPERSAREVEAAITQDRADSELRRRFGQSETARQRQAQGGGRPPGGRACGRSWRGAPRWICITVSGRDDGELRPRLRGDPPARGAGSSGAPAPLRPAGRGVQFHAAPRQRTPMSAARPAHRVTTRHAQAIYPFTAGGGLGGRGAFIGRDASGGAFCFDPWVLYDEGILDDPNAIVIRQARSGCKSALVKTLLWRMLLFGRRAFVLDVKREYGPLCQALGVRPVSLAPGSGVRLNPLAARPEEHAQIDLLRAIATTAIGETLQQVEAATLREALRTVRRKGRQSSRGTDRHSEGRSRPSMRRSPRSCSTRRPRWRLGFRQRLRRSQPSHGAQGARPADLCEGPLKENLRRSHESRTRPPSAAARARSARRPRLARGRDPDGLRDRLDERPARVHGRGTLRPRAADERRPTSLGRSSSTPDSASGFSRTSNSPANSAC